jgi:hypothetical protein
MVVKLGICVAYDWEFLKHSLPAIYNHVDSICLSVDANCKSWNGNPFHVDNGGLKNFVDSIDRDKKIKILQESFYSSDRTPINNECYQRKRMAEVLGEADWIIQIDTDEILMNPKDFINELKKYKTYKRPVNIHGVWINLIKQTETGFIYSVLKTPPLATNRPDYNYGRTNGHFNIYTNSFIAHITWARPEEEVRYKLQNWGHSHEFNGLSFFKIWQALDDFNWRYIKGFHPMNKDDVGELYFSEAVTIEELIRTFKVETHKLPLSVLAANNIWVSRLKKLIKKAGK